MEFTVCEMDGTKSKLFNKEKTLVDNSGVRPDITLTEGTNFDSLEVYNIVKFTITCLILFFILNTFSCQFIDPK